MEKEFYVYSKKILLKILNLQKQLHLEVGDVVSIPPLIWHFHGSLKDDFSHIALRNRDTIDSSGQKHQAGNVWEKEFVNNLSHLNKSEIQQFFLKIEQKVNEIVQGEIRKIKT